MMPEKYSDVAFKKLPPVPASAGNGGSLLNTLSTIKRTLTFLATSYRHVILLQISRALVAHQFDRELCANLTVPATCAGKRT
jgi:hypothetical protein